MFKYHIRNIQPMAHSSHASQVRMVKITQLKNHAFTENMRVFVCDGDHIIFQY